MARSVGVDLFSPDNPDAPYFAIKIEDKIFDIDINYIKQLTVNRTMDDVGDFEFNLVNLMDTSLENKFLKLFQAYTTTMPPISFQYGWSLGEKSPWYRGYLMNYNPTFIPGGYMELNVVGKLMGASATEERIAFYKGKSISEIVAKIAEDMGWVVEELDKSVPFTEERTFRVSNIGIVDYIRKELEPYATNAKNEPFRFYADVQNGGKTHIWFISVNKKVGVQKNYNFFINMGNYGSVLSFSPKYSGLTMSGFLQSAAIDLDTNDVCVYGNEAKAASAEGSSLTIYGSTSPDRMGPLLANKWYQNNIGSITASLEIVGDPTLVPWQSINVAPMMADGSYHRFTAGTYQIRQITDTIAGDYRTSMELFMCGTEDGTKTMQLAEAVKFQGSE